jgi:hypothetical protein
MLVYVWNDALCVEYMNKLKLHIAMLLVAGIETIISGLLFNCTIGYYVGLSIALAGFILFCVFHYE